MSTYYFIPCHTKTLLPKAVFTCLTLFATTVSFASVKDSVGITKVNEQLHIKYLVEPGETIYGISTKYHVPISDLLEINPELENGLKVGQVILIPYHPELVQREKPQSNKIIHKVQSGETLYSLSRKYNVSIEQLMKWNNMDLKAGQEVVVGYTNADETNKKEITVESHPTKDIKPTPSPVSVPKEEPQKQELTKVEKQPVVNEPKPTVSKAEPKSEAPPVSEPEQTEKTYPFDPDMKQVMVIPFDPYLYFSDADHEIAAKSKIPPTKVREVFRRRLSALLQEPGYEFIFLLGGKSKDSISDLNKIYSSVTYHYQKVLDNPYYTGGDIQTGQGHINSKKTSKTWLDRQKEKYITSQNSARAVYDKHEGEYFGVKVKNPEDFFRYFSAKYSVDYYIFVNQFEVKTNYEHCLDRAANDFERTFTTHFSIFDAEGKQIAGNRFKTFYNSNSSYIYTIVGDNMDKIAKRILLELPPPH